jgi:phosphatidylinositol glycan class B
VCGDQGARIFHGEGIVSQKSWNELRLYRSDDQFKKSCPVSIVEVADLAGGFQEVKLALFMKGSGFMVRSLFQNRLYLSYACLALLIAGITSWTNFGHLCGDEYSQILEFGAWRLGHLNHSDLRLWEFESQMRPSIQIWAVVGVFRFLELFGTEANPFVASYLLNLLSGLLSVLSILVFTGAFIRRINPKYRDWFVLLSLFSWLVLYTNTHFNSENISGHLLLLAVGLLYAGIDRPAFPTMIAVGVLLGISFCCRFQVGFSIAGLLVWFFLHARRAKMVARWVALCVSLLLAVLTFGVLADYFFYGNLVVAPFNYYIQNIAEGKMNRLFGTAPWYAYLPLVCIYMPFGPAYVVSTLSYLFRHRNDILTFIIAPFVLFHCMMGHKEVRFMLPLLGFMPAVMLATLDDLLQKRPTPEKNVALVVKGVWVVNLLACVALLFPAATEIGGWYFIHEHHRNPTILYFKASPHQKLLYYRRPNLQVVPVRSGDAMPCPPGFDCLLAVDANSREPKPELPRVYTLFPLHLEGILPQFIVRAIGHFDVYELQNANSKRSD